MDVHVVHILGDILACLDDIVGVRTGNGRQIILIQGIARNRLFADIQGVAVCIGFGRFGIGRTVALVVGQKMINDKGGRILLFIDHVDGQALFGDHLIKLIHDLSVTTVMAIFRSPCQLATLSNALIALEADQVISKDGISEHIRLTQRTGIILAVFQKIAAGVAVVDIDGSVVIVGFLRDILVHTTAVGMICAGRHGTKKDRHDRQ